MANAVYTSGKKELLDRAMGSADLRIVLVDLADYTFSAAHNDLADVPAGARVATSDALASITTTGAVLDAADPTIANVNGDPLEAYIVYMRTGAGTDAECFLLAYIDTESDGSTPIAFTPNGSGVTVSMPNGILSL